MSKDDGISGAEAGGHKGAAPGAAFARGRQAVARRAAYRKWRAKVPRIYAGRRAPRRLRPWYQRLLRAGLWAVLAFGLVLTGLAGVSVVLGGRAVVLPVWAVAETETRLNRALEGRALVVLGGVQAQFTPNGQPILILDGLRLKTPLGASLLALPEVRVEFSRAEMLRARLRPQRLVLSGPRVDLHRDAQGQIDFQIETPEASADVALGLPQILAQLWHWVDLPGLANLDRIDIEAMSLSLRDDRLQRDWVVGDGRATLVRQGQGLALDLGMGLVGGGAAPATAQVTLILPRATDDPGAGRILARFDQVAAADLAAQAAALQFLQVIDAPISGDLRASFDGQAQLTALEGGLSLGEGALSPVEGARPVALNGAQLSVVYDPVRQRVALSQIEVNSPALLISAQGHVDLQDVQAGVPQAFLGQIVLDEVLVNPDGIFAEPVRFGEGALDMRLRLDPFSLDLGQLTLLEEGRRLTARGGISASDAGWRVALDLALDVIAADRLLALWPVTLVPGTREWLLRNVLEGELFNVNGALRLRPEHEPRLSLGYEFAGANVRILPDFPVIRGGDGHAVLEGKVYTLSLARGHLDPPIGGRIDVARSVFQVPDVTQKPSFAEIEIRTESTVTAALSLLDQPPFGYLTKANLSPDLAQGRARLHTRLTLPLDGRVLGPDVAFSVEGQMQDVRSAVLVPGHRFEAAVLDVAGDNKGLTVSGASKLSDVGVSGRWILPLGPGARGSKVEALVDLTPAFGRAFLSGLGAGALTGAGKARLDLALQPGKAPRFDLTSDLVGAGIDLAALGWKKPPRAQGKLSVTGHLENPTRLDSFALEGPGLRVKGSARLTAAGAVQSMDLSQLLLGDWLDASATVASDGRVALTKGSADLRKLPRGAGAASTGGAAGPPIAVRLDQVRVSDSISLTQVEARLSQAAGGMGGPFSGLVNGKAAITGTVAPGPKGPRVTVRSKDAGAVLAASGMFSKAIGGTLEIDFAATGVDGHYDGVARLQGFRVRQMPVLAELLGAISIVGLLDQLGGEGVGFDRAEARFRLTPRALEARDAFASGLSFGLTAEGLYHLREDRFDLQGVISPFYVVNAIGQAVSRPGEGLVGLNYQLGGTSEAPQISINPLSAITPGFLRNIFRRAPAALEDLE